MRVLLTPSASLFTCSLYPQTHSQFPISEVKTVLGYVFDEIGFGCESNWEKV